MPTTTAASKVLRKAFKARTFSEDKTDFQPTKTAGSASRIQRPVKVGGINGLPVGGNCRYDSQFDPRPECFRVVFATIFGSPGRHRKSSFPGTDPSLPIRAAHRTPVYSGKKERKIASPAPAD
jgi:hypothetical protein